MRADGDSEEHPRPRRPSGRAFGVLPRTLRWRLVLATTLLIAISFGITFIAVYRGTGSSLSHQIDNEIASDAGAFSRTLAGTPAKSTAELRSQAERYVRDQPYNGSSTLLFALIPGARPATNQPELLSTDARPDTGETLAEQERENRAAPKLLRPRVGYSTVKLPDVGHLRLLERRATIARHPVVLGVGEPLTSVESAQAGVSRAFILAGILVLVCALGAAYLIGTRFSAPLRRMAGVAARVDAGDLHPRIHEDGNPPEEVRVLADAFNHMLDRLRDAFAGQRAFVADASHELRTPLTVIRGQLELLAGGRQKSPEEIARVSALVQAEIARVSRLVDDLLVLAKAERSELLRPQTLDLERYVQELWTGTLPLAERRFELGEIPAGTLEADPDRLAQALRNLLENAIEHTGSPDGLVRLSVAAVSRATARAQEGRLATGVRFVVDDDGPGIPEDEREQIFGRFHRTDSARDRDSGGAGLGLAIVRAIVQAHGGYVAASASPEGGARIELELPGFRPRTAGEGPPGPHSSDERAGGGVLAGQA